MWTRTENGTDLFLIDGQVRAVVKAKEHKLTKLPTWEMLFFRKNGMLLDVGQFRTRELAMESALHSLATEHDDAPSSWDWHEPAEEVLRHGMLAYA